MSDCIPVGYPWKVCCLQDSTVCTHPRFLRITALVDSLLHQLWSLPSALADILISIAMTVLVRGLSFFDTLTYHWWSLKAKKSINC